MILLFISFISGVLTVLAPCILPLLPIIVGGSLTGEGKDAQKRKVFTIVISLGLSVIAFTLLLKVSTIFIAIPDTAWKWLSGGIIISLGFITVFPSLWEQQWLAKMQAQSNILLGKGERKNSFVGDVLIGAALGPVFSTCSPTYFVILATVLPASPATGLLYLCAYTFGLCLSLFVIAFIGQRIMGSLNIAADPRGWIKRSIGVLFIIVGVFIITGLDKKIETGIINNQLFDVTKVDQYLLKHATPTPVQPKDTMENTSPPNATSTDQGPVVTRAVPTTKSAFLPKAHELVTPDGYLNTGGAPITLGQLKGKKVVLVDFWTYSCINCQRTIPYVNAWYDKYKSQGLEVIGVHTPEFAFEHVESNVAAALKKFGITHPVVLDNEYQTWNAYANQFWPHMYLVDIDGYIVYDHIGEGNYDQTEQAIQKALKERADALGASTSVSGGIVAPKAVPAPITKTSPEIYFGASRNQYLGNGKSSSPTVQTLTLPSSFSPDTLYLGGIWDFGLEKGTTNSAADVVYTYTAKEVYIVASSPTPTDIEVYQDGVLVGSVRGEDVSASGTVKIGESRLYKLIKNSSSGTHTIKLHVKSAGVQFFTFTFG